MYNTGVYNDLNMFVTKCLIQPHKEKARGVFGAIEIFRSLLLRHVADLAQASSNGKLYSSVRFASVTATLARRS